MQRDHSVLIRRDIVDDASAVLGSPRSVLLFD
jgi:hypothetical protein